MPGGRRAGAQSLVVGTLALAAAGMLAKVLSAVSRVLVARWLGAEAIGLYELAAPVLALGISVCGLGVPVAAAAMLGGAVGRGDARATARVLRASRWLLALAGGVGTVAVMLAAPVLARLLGNPASEPVLRAVAPAIVAAVLLAGEKSWLQASGRTTASAAVVTVEQGLRVAAAVAAAWVFRGRGLLVPALAAAAVAWSPLIGAGAGLAGALLAGRQSWRLGPPRDPPPPEEAGGRALLRAGLPNWISGTVAAVASAVDAGLITWRLRLGGVSAALATAQLGELNGMAMPLAAGPAVLFGALASALVPAAAADWARHDQRAVRRRGEAAYFWVLALAVPAAVLLWQLARPLTLLLYHNAEAARPLALLAFVGMPLGLSYVAAALANAVGSPVVLLPGVLTGAGVRSLLILVLTGDRWGTRGAAAAVLCGFWASAAMNVRAVTALTGCRPAWWRWAIPLLAAVALQVAAAHGVWQLTAATGLVARTLITAVVAPAVYGAVLVALWMRWGERWRLPPMPWGRKGE